MAGPVSGRAGHSLVSPKVHRAGPVVQEVDAFPVGVWMVHLVYASGVLDADVCCGVAVALCEYVAGCSRYAAVEVALDVD